MNLATSSVLVFVVLLGASVWLGGFVVIVVVTRIARRQLERPAQVAFFRALGRTYGIVGGGALLVALAGGGVLLAGHPWDGVVLAALVLAAILVLVTDAGVAQARGMTRLRRRMLAEPGDGVLEEQVRRGGRRALVLRAAIGGISVALLGLAAVLAT